MRNSMEVSDHVTEFQILGIIMQMWGGGGVKCHYALTGVPAVLRARSVWSRLSSRIVHVSSSSCVTQQAAGTRARIDNSSNYLPAKQWSHSSAIYNYKFCILTLVFAKISQLLFKYPTRKSKGHKPLKEDVINIKRKLHISETDILSCWLWSTY